MISEISSSTQENDFSSSSSISAVHEVDDEADKNDILLAVRVGTDPFSDSSNSMSSTFPLMPTRQRYLSLSASPFSPNPIKSLSVKDLQNHNNEKPSSNLKFFDGLRTRIRAFSHTITTCSGSTSPTKSLWTASWDPFESHSHHEDLTRTTNIKNNNKNHHHHHHYSSPPRYNSYDNNNNKISGEVSFPLVQTKWPQQSTLFNPQKLKNHRFTEGRERIASTPIISISIPTQLPVCYEKKEISGEEEDFIDSSMNENADLNGSSEINIPTKSSYSSSNNKNTCSIERLNRFFAETRLRTFSSPVRRTTHNSTHFFLNPNAHIYTDLNFSLEENQKKKIIEEEKYNNNNNNNNSSLSNNQNLKKVESESSSNFLDFNHKNYIINNQQNQISNNLTHVGILQNSPATIFVSDIKFKVDETSIRLYCLKVSTGRIIPTFISFDQKNVNAYITFINSQEAKEIYPALCEYFETSETTTLPFLKKLKEFTNYNFNIDLSPEYSSSTFGEISYENLSLSSRNNYHQYFDSNLGSSNSFNNEKTTNMDISKNLIMMVSNKNKKNETKSKYSSESFSNLPSQSSSEEENSSNFQSNMILQVHETSRALWIGNLPPGYTVQQLSAMFTPHGNIESCRILTHKNCGFVNFATEAHAVRSKNAITDTVVCGYSLRVNFAKIPKTAPKQPSDVDVNTTLLTNINGTLVSGVMLPYSNETFNNNLLSNDTNTLFNGVLNSENFKDEQEKFDNSFQESYFHKEEDADDFLYKNELNGILLSMSPSNSIESQGKILIDQSKLREMRIRVENSEVSMSEIFLIHKECMPELLRLSLDSNWNVLVQRLLEKVNQQQRFEMIRELGPRLPVLSLHRHGTWVVQKVVEQATEDMERQVITKYLLPHVQTLLHDNFGNYVMQGCFLRLGEPLDSAVLNSLISELPGLIHSRYGSRAARSCLEESFWIYVNNKINRNINNKFDQCFFLPNNNLDECNNTYYQLIQNNNNNNNNQIYDDNSSNINFSNYLLTPNFSPQISKSFLNDQQQSRCDYNGKILAKEVLKHSGILASHPNGVLILSWFLDSTAAAAVALNTIDPLYYLAVELLPFISKLGIHKIGSNFLLRLVSAGSISVKELIFDHIFKNQLSLVLMDLLHGDFSAAKSFFMRLLEHVSLEETKKEYIDQLNKATAVLLNLTTNVEQNHDHLNTSSVSNCSGLNEKNSITTNNSVFQNCNQNIKKTNDLNNNNQNCCNSDFPSATVMDLSSSSSSSTGSKNRRRRRRRKRGISKKTTSTTTLNCFCEDHQTENINNDDDIE